MPGREVPQEIARGDEHVLDGVDASAVLHQTPQVHSVARQVDAEGEPGDLLQGLDEARRDGNLHAVQLADPQVPEHGRLDEHVQVQRPVQRQVPAAGGGRARARLEVVDAAEAVLLHDAVLMVPGRDHEQQGDRRPGEPRGGEPEDDDGPEDEPVLEARPLLRHAVAAHPARVVVGHRDPEVDGGHHDVGQPHLEAQRDRHRQEGQPQKPHQVEARVQDVAGAEGRFARPIAMCGHT